MDQYGEGTRGEVAGGMPVGDLRALRRRLEDLARGALAQAERRGAHDRAATLGVRVDRPGRAQWRATVAFHGTSCLGVQAGQAGVSRGAPGVQPSLLAQPTGAE